MTTYTSQVLVVPFSQEGTKLKRSPNKDESMPATQHTLFLSVLLELPRSLTKNAYGKQNVLVSRNRCQRIAEGSSSFPLVLHGT